jgi:small subunit ribosomal protein S16
MLKMRLQRVGRKHEPAFRLVLTDSKNSTKSGKYNEILGSYDARKKTDLLKTDRIQYWLGKGIAVTGTVHNLLVSHKILDAKKTVVPVTEEAPASAVVESAPVEEIVPEVAEVEVPVESPVAEETATIVEAEPVTESNPVVEAPSETPVEASPEPTTETPAEEVI